MTDSSANGAEHAGFLDRARLRRRLRQLERFKEIGLRDVGGLTLELHRAGKEDKQLVDKKLAELDTIDEELRALRATLSAESNTIDLYEAGLAACTNCGALVGSGAKFCSECGTPTDAS